MLSSVVASISAYPTISYSFPIFLSLSPPFRASSGGRIHLVCLLACPHPRHQLHRLSTQKTNQLTIVNLFLIRLNVDYLHQNVWNVDIRPFYFFLFFCYGRMVTADGSFCVRPTWPKSMTSQKVSTELYYINATIINIRRVRSDLR